MTISSSSSGTNLTFDPLTSGAGILPASDANAAEMLAFRLRRMAGETPAPLRVQGLIRQIIATRVLQIPI